MMSVVICFFLWVIISLSPPARRGESILPWNQTCEDPVIKEIATDLPHDNWEPVLTDKTGAFSSVDWWRNSKTHTQVYRSSENSASDIYLPDVSITTPPIALSPGCQRLINQAVTEKALVREQQMIPHSTDLPEAATISH
jgi:hypothetical protein